MVQAAMPLQEVSGLNILRGGWTRTYVSEFMRSLYGDFCTEKNDQNFLGTFFDYPKGIGIIRKR